MRAWRHALHRVPEIADHEVRTRGIVLRSLREIGLRGERLPGSTGVIATLFRDRPGPVVALRSDMDGLPVEEGTRLSFRSRVPGMMHACGHDVHLASLLGAAALLRQAGRAVRGPVRLIFQPAEEEGTVGGALPMIERGALDRPKVDYVVGQHVVPELPVGTIGWRSGTLMAAADRFVLTVRGTGGHAAYPHRGPDAILAACEIVQGLQSLVSRATDPLDPVVISVGSLHGGNRHNVLPEEVVIEGTVRTIRPSTRDRIESQIRRRAGHLAESSGARVKVQYIRGYPVTSNDPGATRTIVGALEREFGTDRLVELAHPVMGAEDFSRYLERVPGSFLFLGTGRPGTPPAELHNARFAPPDEALAIGAAALAAATEGLQRA